MRYNCMFFFLLKWDECLIFANSFYWSGHILTIAMLIIGIAFPARKEKKRVEKVIDTTAGSQ